MKWIKRLFSRRRLYRDLSEEIREHLEQKVEELVAGGMSREEAEYLARREFGNVTLMERDSREVWRWSWMEDFLTDVRYGLRGLRKNPGFTAVAILTLALGIGANTAIFSVVNAVLLRPLPFQNAGRLVRAFGTFPISNESDVSPPDFLDYRAQNHVFDHLEGLIDGNTIFNLAGSDKPTQVKGTVVTAGFFDLLGIQPLLGRTFVAADEGVSRPQVVVLSHQLWRERFGGDASAIGKSVVLDGSRMTVVGVLREDVPLFSDGDLWIPAPFEVTGMKSREARFLRVYGVLKAGTTMAQAQAELDTISARLTKQYPDSNAEWGMRLVPLQTSLVGDVRPALLVLLGAVALVLLIACANVASLLLARNTSRTREIAIRVTLGAGRLRLVRQMLTESVLLALAGGAAGIVLAKWGVDFLKGLAPENLPRLNEVSVSGTVLAFTGCVALLTGILFGLGPALQASRRDTTQNLKEGGAAGQSRSKHRAHNVLVIAEVALSLVVLIASGLLVNSFWRLTHVNPGFDPSNIVTAQISVTGPELEKEAQRRAFFDQLQERTVSMPGVESAGFVSELPLDHQGNDTYVAIAEHPPVRPADRLNADIRVVAGDYFQTMRIPLLEGREFTPRDTADSTFTVLINEPFAKRFFAGEDPVGKHLQIYEGEPEFVTREIVGVVGGIKHIALQEALRPEMFLPYAQRAQLRMNIVVRSAGNPLSIASAIRSAVSSLDPNEATSDFRTLGEIVSSSAAGDRFNTFLLAGFGGMALLLTAAGIFGVLSYLVAQRTREIGLRMALGARRPDISRVIVGHGMRLVLTGVGMGLLGAYGVTRWMSSFLFGIAPTDTLTFLAVSALLATAGFLACYLPARRAMRVDPMVALRSE
jgi:putative ABC transport system permease protein